MDPQCFPWLTRREAVVAGAVGCEQVTELAVCYFFHLMTHHFGTRNYWRSAKVRRAAPAHAILSCVRSLESGSGVWAPVGGAEGGRACVSLF